jgi:hypothetical protein
VSEPEDVSEPIVEDVSVEVEGLGVEELGVEELGVVLVSVVVDVDELVLWSASMLPVVLVPVAVLASGVVVVVPDTDVSLVGYELFGSPPWATAAELNRTDEMTIASAFLRMR